MGNRLYCGNLAFQATEDELRTLFSAFGQVVSVHMVTDRETGRPRGFAFVEMVDDRCARAAIVGLDGSRHLERNLQITEARPREERGPGGGGGGRGPGPGGPGGGGFGGGGGRGRDDRGGGFGAGRGDRR